MRMSRKVPRLSWDRKRFFAVSTALNHLATFLSQYEAHRVSNPGQRDELIDEVAAIFAAAIKRQPSQLSRRLLERFNRLARNEPVTFELLRLRSGGGPVVMRRGSTLNGPIVDGLFHALRLPIRDRFKRCRTCRQWFFDETRNKSKRGCSDKCTWRWWTRTRRRQALTATRGG
jgi:hypothetical protein